MTIARPHNNSATFTSPVFDQPRAEAAVRELLIAIGEDPDRHGLEDTPARVARAYKEMFAGLYTDPDTVLNTTFDEQHDELVLVKQIPLYSTCEHHPARTAGSPACRRSRGLSICMPSGRRSRNG